jgi:thioredoxin reductase (NADPH)
MESKYDLIIIGAGPAGLSSGIYAGRYLLKTLIIGEINGGTISEAHKVCNFPSYTEITGFELSNKMYNHAITNGSEITNEKVIEIKKMNQSEFEVKTDKTTYFSKKVILANGRKKRLLNVKGEKEFLGKGVSYCATCDGGFYKDKSVAVVGGSNAALTAALLLSEYAKKVMIMYRKDNFFRAEPAWVELAKKNSKIEFLFNTEIEEIIGKNSVEKVLLKNGKEIELDGVFVEIGSIPDNTFEKQLEIETEKGYIITNKKQETNIKGVFAAGDITNNSLKQAVTAASEGAIAASSAYEEINLEK